MPTGVTAAGLTLLRPSHLRTCNMSAVSENIAPSSFIFAVIEQQQSAVLQYSTTSRPCQYTCEHTNHVSMYLYYVCRGFDIGVSFPTFTKLRHLMMYRWDIHAPKNIEIFSEEEEQCATSITYMHVMCMWMQYIIYCPRTVVIFLICFTCYCDHSQKPLQRANEQCERYTYMYTHI